jgi:hypothetical protein
MTVMAWIIRADGDAEVASSGADIGVGAHPSFSLDALKILLVFIRGSSWIC